MIACVSPAEAHLDESLCTLQYAYRAKGIVNSPAVNLVGAPRGAANAAAASALDAETLGELAALRDEVRDLREKNRRLTEDNAKLAALAAVAKAHHQNPAPSSDDAE